MQIRIWHPIPNSTSNTNRFISLIGIIWASILALLWNRSVKIQTKQSGAGECENIAVAAVDVEPRRILCCLLLKYYALLPTKVLFSSVWCYTPLASLKCCTVLGHVVLLHCLVLKCCIVVLGVIHRLLQKCLMVKCCTKSVGGGEGGASYWQPEWQHCFLGTSSLSLSFA